MGGELSFFLVVWVALSGAHSPEAEDFPDLNSAACRTLLRVVYRQLERLTACLVPSRIWFQADGNDWTNRSSNGRGTSFRGRRRAEGNVPRKPATTISTSKPRPKRRTIKYGPPKLTTVSSL